MCGFGSFGAIGIQIGALVAMAPSRRKDFARIALRAMIAGNVACFMTACIAGLFVRFSYIEYRLQTTVIPRDGLETNKLTQSQA